MAKRVVPDQPGVRVGATKRHRVQGPAGENTALLAQLKAWMASHKNSCVDSLKRIVKQPFGSFFTCLVIAVTLSLPMGLNLLIKSLESVGGHWQQAAQISVFLRLDASQQQTDALLERLSQHSAVAQVELIDSEQAVAEFSKFSGMGEVLAQLPNNPLPASLRITPKEIAQERLLKLVEDLQSLQVVSQVQLDSQWVERLQAILALGERFIFALTLLLIATLLLVVGNTLRLHIESRRTEIEVIKLVGGTDSYVRRPFLYMGIVYGIGGGLIAWLFLVLGFSWLDESVTALAQLYGSSFNLGTVPLEDGFSLLFGAVLLGYFAAWMAVARHLHELLPS